MSYKRLLSRFQVFLLLVGLVACIPRPPKLLYTFDNQTDTVVLNNFPHNCLRYKTSIEMVERGDKKSWEKNPDWIKFKSMMVPTDEIWACSTEHPSLPRHSNEVEGAGKEGLCLIRKGKIIAIYDCFTVVVI